MKQNSEKYAADLADIHSAWKYATHGYFKFFICA